jgi:hypothetical protein
VTIKAQAAGSLRVITAVKVKVAGVVRSCSSVKVMSGGTLRTVFSAPSSTLALSLNYSSLSVTGAASSLTSAIVTGTATGGTGPYTYAWTRTVDPGYATVTANSPAAASTSFTASGLISSEPDNATYRCTVTDSLGATAAADVALTFTRS